MKRLRYDHWQDLAWYGVKLNIPDEWNPGQLVGDAGSGNVRLDDAQIVRAEIEWKEAGGDPDAVRRAEDPWSAAPGTAAQNTTATISARHPGRTVRRSAVVSLMPAVLDPFPHIAMDIVKTKIIWPKTPCR